jgi:hypothetical protein
VAVVVALAVALVVACGPAGPSATLPSASAPVVVTPSSSPVPASPSPAAARTTVPTASAVVENPAPPELAGSWGTTGSDRIILTFVSDRYSISRGPGSARGRIAVRGDEIEFFGSDLCVGSGVYRWAVAAATLTLTPVGTPDPCGMRSDALVDRSFARR